LNIDDIEKAMICLDEGLKVYPGRKVGSFQLAADN